MKHATMPAATLLACLALATAAVHADTRAEAEARARATFDSLPARASAAAAGMCIVWGDRTYLHAPFATREQLDAFLAGLPDPVPVADFETQGRWTSTTRTPLVALRSPMVLTYSFVPDGTPVPDAGFGGPSTSNLFATLNAAFPEGETKWKGLLASVLDSYAALSAIRYAEVPDDGAALYATSGSDAPSASRGDIRILMRPIDGPGGLLAFAFFPSSGGDITLDSDEASLWAARDGDHLRLRNTFAHEHGHSLGYLHVDPRNQTKLMEAQVPFAFDGLQEDDIRGLQSQYGDRFEANGSAATAASLGTLDALGAPLSIENVCLEGLLTQDWYTISLSGPALLDVTLEPKGTTYPEGPENGPVADVNALTVQDLVLEVLAPDGTTILASRNNRTAGGIEEAFGLDVWPTHGAGPYHIRVLAAANAPGPQRYRLILATSPPSASGWVLY